MGMGQRQRGLCARRPQYSFAMDPFGPPPQVLGPYSPYQPLSPALTGDVQIRLMGSTDDGRKIVSTHLRSEAAWQLADLHSIVADLHRIRELCDLFRRAGQLGELGQAAVAESATITYGRCHKEGQSARGKGQRRRIPQSVMDSLSPELRRTHDLLLRDRDKHIGHRVHADMEQVQVLALRHEGESDAFMVDVFQVRMDRADLSDVRLLVAALIDALEPMLAAEQAALREEFNAREARSRAEDNGEP
jgi:hypothetical protein